MKWTNHRQASKPESVAILESPVNFIVSTHSKGKKRPKWALIDNAYMHNTWRTSQSSYHLFRSSKNVSSSDSVNVLLEDLLRLCVHSYDTIRTSPEYAVLGSCAVRGTQTVIKHLALDCLTAVNGGVMVFSVGRCRGGMPVKMTGGDR
nr:proteasome activator subunit 4 [Tanacetum cinerariifolium]